MPQVGRRTIAVAATAGALWLGLGPTARAEQTFETRIPFVPTGALPPLVVLDDPASGLQVRLDPGDYERPDPAPKLVIKIP